MPCKTKKEFILATFIEEGFLELTPQAIETINSRLIETYGSGGRTSTAYIAQTLMAANKQIFYQDQLDELNLTYSENSLHNLGFDTLDDAQRSLFILDDYFKKLSLEEDFNGIFQCKKFAKRAKLRAKLISQNEKLSIEKRTLKQELVFWFEIWLSTPEIFKEWLTLRRASKDFQEKFGLQ